MALAVVTVAAGGLPVVIATNGLGRSVAEAPNGKGVAVTQLTLPKGGVPVVYVPAAAPTGGPPVPQSATVATAAVSVITINFNRALDPASVPLPTDFLAIANFVGKSPVSVSISGAAVALTFDAAYGVTSLTVGYTPGSPPLRASDGTPVAAFDNYPVT